MMVISKGMDIFGWFCHHFIKGDNFYYLLLAFLYINHHPTALGYGDYARRENKGDQNKIARVASLKSYPFPVLVRFWWECVLMTRLIALCLDIVGLFWNTVTICCKQSENISDTILETSTKTVWRYYITGPFSVSILNVWISFPSFSTLVDPPMKDHL